MSSDAVPSDAVPSEVGSAQSLTDMTWPEVEARTRGGALLVVPLGSCEQHGPHLPLDTDTRIAVALAQALVDRLDTPSAPLVLAPAVAVGASGEHESFPGTLSIGTLALETVLVELVRSALPAEGSDRPRPFRGVVLVNGHGGNVEATNRAAALLAEERRDVLVWHPRVPDGDSHAGRTETSMLLHLDPSAVRMDLAEPGSVARWREIGPIVMSDGLSAVTPNGVLGDPTGATAAEGESVVAALVDHLCAAVEAWVG